MDKAFLVKIINDNYKIDESLKPVIRQFILELLEFNKKANIIDFDILSINLKEFAIKTSEIIENDLYINYNHFSKTLFIPKPGGKESSIKIKLLQTLCNTEIKTLDNNNFILDNGFYSLYAKVNSRNNKYILIDEFGFAAHVGMIEHLSHLIGIKNDDKKYPFDILGFFIEALHYILEDTLLTLFFTSKRQEVIDKIDSILSEKKTNSINGMNFFAQLDSFYSLIKARRIKNNDDIEQTMQFSKTILNNTANILIAAFIQRIKRDISNGENMDRQDIKGKINHFINLPFTNILSDKNHIVQNIMKELTI